MSVLVVVLDQDEDEFIGAFQQILDQSPFLCVNFPSLHSHFLIVVSNAFAQDLLLGHGLACLLHRFNGKGKLCCVLQCAWRLLFGCFHSKTLSFF